MYIYLFCLLKEKRLEEQRKYGVFFDDDYDYMQHLKDVNEVYELEQVTDNRNRNEIRNVSMTIAIVRGIFR